MVPNLRGPTPRSRFAKASRLLTNRTQVQQPTSAATGVTPQLQRMGEKSSAMAAGTARSDGSWMGVWNLAQGETAGLSPTGAMDIDSSWACHQR